MNQVSTETLEQLQSELKKTKAIKEELVAKGMYEQAAYPRDKERELLEKIEKLKKKKEQ